jgi:hypothetical protein
VVGVCEARGKVLRFATFVDRHPVGHPDAVGIAAHELAHAVLHANEAVEVKYHGLTVNVNDPAERAERWERGARQLCLNWGFVEPFSTPESIALSHELRGR